MTFFAKNKIAFCATGAAFASSQDVASQVAVDVPLDGSIDFGVVDWDSYSAFSGPQFARDAANGQFVKANSGHWKCWQNVLRDYPLGFAAKVLFGHSDDPVAEDQRRNSSKKIFASSVPELSLHRASYHADVLNVMSINGMPVSAACCLPEHGSQGRSDCWAANSMSADLCCGKPILPKRCFDKKAFALEINFDGDIVSGAWHQGVVDEFDCATLDDFSIYFQTRILGGSDKGSQLWDYLRHYEKFIQGFGASGRVLELGVQSGHSLAMWSMWFPNGEVLGVDIQDVAMYPQLTARGANITGNVQIIIDDATSQSFVDRLGHRRFELIVDGASHVAADQIKSFEMLFPSVHLVPGGIYCIEDIWDDAAHEYFEALSSHLIRGRDQEPFIQFVDDGILHEVGQRDWRILIQSINIRKQMVIIEKRKDVIANKK